MSLLSSAQRAVQTVRNLRMIPNLDPYGDKPRAIAWDENPYTVARDMLDMADCIKRATRSSDGVVTGEFVADLLETYAKRVETLR